MAGEVGARTGRAGEGLNRSIQMRGRARAVQAAVQAVWLLLVPLLRTMHLCTVALQSSGPTLA